jgi:hypothetical protein
MQCQRGLLARSDRSHDCAGSREDESKRFDGFGDALFHTLRRMLWGAG